MPPTRVGHVEMVPPWTAAAVSAFGPTTFAGACWFSAANTEGRPACEGGRSAELICVSGEQNPSSRTATRELHVGVTGSGDDAVDRFLQRVDHRFHVDADQLAGV